MKGLGIKKGLTLLATVLIAHVASAQYVPAMSVGKKVKVPEKAGYWHRGNTFQHLDVALSLGITGIGIEVASPICEIAQVRVGYEFMPHFHYSVNFPVEVGGEPAVKYDDNGKRVQSRFDRLAKNLKELTGLEADDHLRRSLGLKATVVRTLHCIVSVPIIKSIRKQVPKMRLSPMALQASRWGRSIVVASIR